MQGEEHEGYGVIRGGPVQNMYNIKLKNRRIKCHSSNIYPSSCDQFMLQQIYLLSEIHFFSKDFDLVETSIIPSSIDNKVDDFYPTFVKGISENNHFVSLFKNYLAVYRNKTDIIPYAFLKHVKNKVASDHFLEINDANDRSSVEKIHDEDFVTIKWKSVYLVFENKKVLYSMDMGFMYMLILHPMYRDLFFKNVLEILEIQEMTFFYDQSNRLVFFAHKDGGVHKFIGFNVDPCNFVVFRKITFTQNRHKVLASEVFREIEDPHVSHDKIQVLPWTEIRFLHLQLVFAFHLLEYFTHSKTHCEWNEQWKMYKKSLGQLYETILQEINKKTKFPDWNPEDAIFFLKRFGPEENYIMKEDDMDEIFIDEIKQCAWLANFHSMLSIYTTLLLEGGRIYVKNFFNNEQVIQINNEFVGSYMIEPIRMQAMVYYQQCKFIKEKIVLFFEDDVDFETETKTPVLPEPSIFCPDLQSFSIPVC